MTAKIIDGNAVARHVRAQWKARVEALKVRGTTPGLAVIIVGDNPGSKVYVRNKVKACAEVGIRPNLDEYLRGRSQGLFSYCQPENGFVIGRRGESENAADCPASMRFAFLDQYRHGQEIHLIESDLEQRRSRLNRNNRRLRGCDERIAAVRTELTKNDLPTERRVALSNELNKLVDEKNFIVNENGNLRLESDRLQSHLYFRLREMGR